MRRILSERPPDYRPPESGNEARFQWLCERHGIRVRRQVEIGTEDHFVTRVDFQDVAYPHLVYRIQSARWHGAVSHARDDAHQKDELMGDASRSSTSGTVTCGGIPTGWWRRSSPPVDPQNG